jgi:predicted nucleic acid-binding protein
MTWKAVMPEAISNTSPLLYLHRIGVLDWLPRLFSEIWVPSAVVQELDEGRLRGYDVPDPLECAWVRIVEPRSIPSEWFALDLGPGELAAVSLALDNPALVVLLDDALARRIAQAAGLNVWGTLKVLLEAKSHGLTEDMESLLDRLRNAGMWVSEDIHRRILTLARERMG